MVVPCDLKNWATGDGDCQPGMWVQLQLQLQLQLQHGLMNYANTGKMQTYPVCVSDSFPNSFSCCGQTNKLFVIIAGWQWPPDRVKSSGLGVERRSLTLILSWELQSFDESQIRTRGGKLSKAPQLPTICLGSMATIFTLLPVWLSAYIPHMYYSLLHLHLLLLYLYFYMLPQCVKLPTDIQANLDVFSTFSKMERSIIFIFAFKLKLSDLVCCCLMKSLALWRFFWNKQTLIILPNCLGWAINPLRFDTTKASGSLRETHGKSF